MKINICHKNLSHLHDILFILSFENLVWYRLLQQGSLVLSKKGRAQYLIVSSDFAKEIGITFWLLRAFIES